MITHLEAGQRPGRRHKKEVTWWKKKWKRWASNVYVPRLGLNPAPSFSSLTNGQTQDDLGSPQALCSASFLCFCSVQPTVYYSGIWGTVFPPFFCSIAVMYKRGGRRCLLKWPWRTDVTHIIDRHSALEGPLHINLVLKPWALLCPALLDDVWYQP